MRVIYAKKRAAKSSGNGKGGRDKGSAIKLFHLHNYSYGKLLPSSVVY